MAGDLPVVEVIEQIRAALNDSGSCVLIARPGTGKTTGVPPLLLDEPWLDGQRILMLEPRRLAARVGASRMASTHGEQVGETYGYSVRGESRVSNKTRVEVMTEGLFLRRLQNDPSLDGVGVVILDEFHERSVDSDLALTLLVEARASLRPDLRVMVMSATMDPGPVAELIGAPTIVATATAYQVDTHYRPGCAHVPIEERTADVTIEALRSESGDVLVFLPGRPEINRTRRILEKRFGGEPNSPKIVELHGSLSPKDQQLAIESEPSGRRKVVLSTSLAETSITVEGVRSVIDSGRRRTNVVDPRTGLPGLVTKAVSRAGADQRRGRAGRTAPGVAYRLWVKEDDRHRRDADEPEILSADLSSLMLQLRAWGVADPGELEWLDAPPETAVERARDLLEVLGAVDEEGRLSDLGREFVSIGFHPRLAAMAITGVSLGYPDLAAEVCAVVETSRSGPIDIVERVESLRSGESGGELRPSLKQWRRIINSLSHMKSTTTDLCVEEAVAEMVMVGYPDRVALVRGSKRTDTAGRSRAVFQLRTGSEVMVPEHHPFERSKWLAITEVDVESQRVHLGVALSDSQVMRRFASEFSAQDVVEWNDRRSTIESRRLTFLGAIKVDDQPLNHPPIDLVSAAVAEAFNKRGLALFGRLAEADVLRSRVAMIRQVLGEDAVSEWPDLSDDALCSKLPQWLGDRMSKISTVDDFNRVDVVSLLREQLRWDQLASLDELVPIEWRLVSGRRVRLLYGHIDGAAASVLAQVRLRDAFGTDTHPMVMAGRVPVTVELLSPAGRPVQRTTDLPGFWRGSYRDVRSDLRGRYPKHPWPEEPWSAVP